MFKAVLLSNKIRSLIQVGASPLSAVQLLCCIFCVDMELWGSSYLVNKCSIQECQAQLLSSYIAAMMRDNGTLTASQKTSSHPIPGLLPHIQQKQILSFHHKSFVRMHLICCPVSFCFVHQRRSCCEFTLSSILWWRSFPLAPCVKIMWPYLCGLVSILHRFLKVP